MRWDRLTDKAHLRRFLRQVQALKTWQLVVLLFIFVIISATFLRINNLNMVERRSAVIAADEKADDEALRSSIVSLQQYVTAHMNTGLDKGFFLSKTYDRDRDTAIASADSAPSDNSTVYQQASIECRAKWHGGVESFRNDYVQCVIARVSALGQGSDPASNIKLPKADAYRINFSSPRWSFDLAGISVAICLLIITVIFGRLLLLLTLRLVLRRHYRSI
jgi:hypothetical protein